MTRSSSIRRVMSVTAAGFAAVTAAGLASAPAHASTVRPAACTVIDIGKPGQIYAAGVYTGEVEQQYDNCHDVRAHFQWSTAFRSAHPDAVVNVEVISGSLEAGAGSSAAYQSQDAYSGWVSIYADAAETWAADARIDGPCDSGDAMGDWHDYSNGAETGSPTNGSC